MLDVFFLSYHEPFADEHFQSLLALIPHATRVDGVEGIYAAHKKCAKKSKTLNFFVVDADALVHPDFNFKYMPPEGDAYPDIPEENCIHVWKAINPVNGLIYGNGGIKLFNKMLFMKSSAAGIDVTTSINNSPIVTHDKIGNTTMFNLTPYSAWRSAFRECAKLSSNIIANSDNGVNEELLNIWCTIGNAELNGRYCIDGANDGRQYAEMDNDLNMINNSEWMKARFDERYN